MLSEKKIAPVPIDKKIASKFLDTYVLDFLDLPEKHSERDLQKAIIHNLKNSILEIGQDFTFVMVNLMNDFSFEIFGFCNPEDLDSEKKIQENIGIFTSFKNKIYSMQCSVNCSFHNESLGLPHDCAC